MSTPMRRASTNQFVEVRAERLEGAPVGELVGGDGHDLLPIVVAIVPPREAHLAILDVEQAIVGNGDAVRIAADVFEDLLRSGEWRLGVDHPWGLP